MLRKQAKRDAKKAAKRAAMTTGQKVGRFFLKLLGILLALAVLVTAAACALVYFGIVDIPVVSNIMEKFIRTDAVETTDFQMLQEDAISRKVTDQESARQALDDIAPQLGIKDVEKELGECREDAVLGNAYYRFPQEYQGIPVYGRSVVVVTDNTGNVMFVSGNLTGVDKLDTKPTISFEEASKVLTDYITNMPDYRENTETAISPAGSSPLVIYRDGNAASLAYVIEASFQNQKGVNCGEFIVDANTGEVLHFAPTLYEVSGYTASDVNRSNGFPIFQADDGNYYLWNVDENFYVFNLNGLESQYSLKDSKGRILKSEDNKPYTIDQWSKGEFVLSENEIFGDNDIERSKDYESGARLLIHTMDISEFFKSLGFSNDKRVYLYYRDGYDNGRNALGGFLTSDIGVISMGMTTGVGVVDVIAHELTHFVSRSIVGWDGDNETSSINEAVSDIFGEIIESKVSNQEIDWQMHIYRNIKMPDGDCLSDYSQYYDSIDSHAASTIISHAAYLMWKGIDGSDTFEALTTEELAKLLYATLYTLPTDCTFSQFRTLTQHTARTMNFTEKQLRCISNAFFQVGIPETELSVAKTVSLEVLYVDGTPDHDYTVYVQGNGTEQIYTSSTIEAKGLEFPDAGNFEITVIDNAHDYIQCSRLVRVTDTGGVEKLTMTIADKVKEENPSIPADAVEFNGHRYYLYDFAGLAEPTQNTWENAQAYCEAVGGYLATITTPEENDFLYRYMRQRGYASAYFGLSNTQTGAWQWGNGELLTYTNWHSGEPNNQNGNEHYGMFYESFSDGTWNDGRFDAPYTEPQQERQDIVSTVTASSYLPAGTTDSYEPANVLDGDLATAWAEEKGAGETISFTFDDSYRIGGIVISVGYQKSDELYGANSRPAEIRVTGDNGFEQLCSVQDLNGRQEVVFNQFANTRSLSVTIENIYEGSDCSDTCISEIAFLIGSGVSGSSDGGTAFLCEWGEPAETGKAPNNSSQMQATDSERSIALVLDTSGSMSGTPIEETRKAASNFVFSVLPENAAVGVVTYTEYAQVQTDFTMDSSKLEEIVSNLSAGGGTNIDDGLKQAYNMLQRTSSKKKIIILMSDGEPNNGRTGDELIAFADEIKQSGVYIYTLGFFDALGDRTSAQYLMERLASDGCHYEVSSAEDLVFFFGDIASQINGQKYIYIRIACPVDVTVSYGGETLTSAEDALNTRTDFGTLTFEDSEKTTDAAQTDQVKILRLKEGVDYDVKITGTGYGMMDYTIGFMDDDGQYSDLRYFEDIRITRNTMIEATAAVSDQSVLKVDTDGDGRFDIAYRAGQNEHAQQTKVIPWLTVTLVAAGTVVLAVVLVVILQKKKKRKVR